MLLCTAPQLQQLSVSTSSRFRGSQTTVAAAVQKQLRAAAPPRPTITWLVQALLT